MRKDIYSIIVSMKAKYIAMAGLIGVLLGMPVNGATTYQPERGEDWGKDRSTGPHVLRAVSIPLEKHGLKTSITVIVKCYPDGEWNIVCAYAGKSSLKCYSKGSAVLYEGAAGNSAEVWPESVGDYAKPPNEAYRWIDSSASFSACKDESGLGLAPWIIPHRAVERVLFTAPTVHECRTQRSYRIETVRQRPKTKLTGRLCTAEQAGNPKPESSIIYQIDMDVSVTCLLPEDIPVYFMKKAYEAEAEYLKKNGDDEGPLTVRKLMDAETFECGVPPTRVIVMKRRATWRFRVFNDDFRDPGTDEYKEFEDRFHVQVKDTSEQ